MKYLILLVMLLVPVVALAQEPVPQSPLLSMDRVSLGAGLSYRWALDEQWVPGLYGAYNMGPLWSFVGSAELPFAGTENPFDSEKPEYQFGVRVRLFQGGQ